MNIHPLRIGYAISDILNSSELIAEHVHGRVFAYTTKEKVAMPNIVYDGVSIEYEETKDGAEPSEATLSIKVNTTDYPTGIAIAEEVMDALAEHEGIVPMSASCEYDQSANMFTHNLTLKVYIQ